MPNSNIKKAKTNFGKIISSLNHEELNEFIHYIKEAIGMIFYFILKIIV